MQQSLLRSAKSYGSLLGNRNVLPRLSKSIFTSHSLSESFTVQDPKDFEERVKKSKTPVVVDFFANWCQPCRVLAPRIESIIAENVGKIKLAKVNIDDNTDLALDYEVSSIPVLLIIRNGKVEHRLEGLQDSDKLKKWVDDAIESEPQFQKKTGQK